MSHWKVNSHSLTSRKCRATDQGEEGPRRKVRTMWDVDSSRTSALLEDMGVSVLPGTNTEQQTMFVDSDEEDQEMSSPPNQYPTPEILVVQNCQPPPVSACFQQVYFNPMSHLVDLRICLEKITRYNKCPLRVQWWFLSLFWIWAALIWSGQTKVVSH